MARNNDRSRGSKRAPAAASLRPRRGKPKVCVFCRGSILWVDYKDANLLGRFLSERAKIKARRTTGNCNRHQREVAVAIKTARELACSCPTPSAPWPSASAGAAAGAGAAGPVARGSPRRGAVGGPGRRGGRHRRGARCRGRGPEDIEIGADTVSDTVSSDGRRRRRRRRRRRGLSASGDRG